MNRPSGESGIASPAQSRPVYRDEWTAPAAQRAEGGLESAASKCVNLTGAARQMCYAQLGVTM